MDDEVLETRPAILVVGSPNVGKRTLVSRLLGVPFEDESQPSNIHGWTIDNKYYAVDVSLWIVNLDDGFSLTSSRILSRIVALVFVFDVSNISSFLALKDWVSFNDIQNFDIRLCIGNKVDLITGHPSHVEYRRRLLKKYGGSSENPLEFPDYGISETEGSFLLGDGGSGDYKALFLEWCLENNIEFVEACASNSDFDNCLSMDGDSQGVERLHGALSAHMWPGMVLKSGDKINEPSLPEYEESSEEESDYQPEYEVLSSGSAEPWDDVRWMNADNPGPSEGDLKTVYSENEKESIDQEHLPSISASKAYEEQSSKEASLTVEEDRKSGPDDEKAFDFEDIEALMAEIGNMRNGLRLMPDFQRREMAAKLAMKMAAMFGDGSESEDGLE